MAGASAAPVRTSFAEAPLPASLVFGQPGEGQDSARMHLRARKGSSKGRGVASATSPQRAAEAAAFVFHTPGDSGSSASARRHGTRRSRFSIGHPSPTANLFGASPAGRPARPADSCDSMAWSPYSTSDDVTSAPAPPLQQQPEQQQQPQAEPAGQPGRPQRTGPVATARPMFVFGSDTAQPAAQAGAQAATAAAAPPAEQFSFLHLHSQHPTAPAEQFSRLHLEQENVPQPAQAAAPGGGAAAASAAAAAAAAVAEQQLPYHLRTQLHMSGVQELPQQFASKVNLAAGGVASGTSCGAAGAADAPAAAADLGGDGAAPDAVPLAAEEPRQPTAPPAGPTEQNHEAPSARGNSGLNSPGRTFGFCAGAVPGGGRGRKPGMSPAPGSRVRSPQRAAAKPAAAATAAPAAIPMVPRAARQGPSVAGPGQPQEQQTALFGRPQPPPQQPFVFGVTSVRQEQTQAQAAPAASAGSFVPAAPVQKAGEHATLPQPSFVFGHPQQQQQQLQEPHEEQQQQGFVGIKFAGQQGGPAGGGIAPPHGRTGSAQRRARTRMRASAAAPAPLASSATGPVAAAAFPAVFPAAAAPAAASAPAATAAGTEGTSRRVSLPKPPVFAGSPSQLHKRDHLPPDPAAAAAARSEQQRSRGNEAFNKQRYREAAELYTQAIEALWPYPQLHSRLAVLLANRAAAMLSMSRPLAALADCKVGLQHDPTFLRCVLRIATVHTRMGNFPAAYAVLEKQRQACQQQRQAGQGIPAELAAAEAALAQVAAREVDVVRHEAALLAALQALGHQTPPPAAPPTAAAGAGVGTSNARPAVAAADVGGGLKHLDAAALAVPHCEAVFAARALALLRLGKWKEAVAVCDARVTQDEQVAAEDDSMPAGSWRHWVRAQNAFHLGQYDDVLLHLETLLAALAAAAKEEAAASAPPFGGNGGSTEPAGGPSPPPAASKPGSAALLAAVAVLPGAEDLRALAGRLREAKRLRHAGNELVQAGRYTEAIKQYSAALEAGELSAAFAAVLYCNRAAAYQGQQQWVHAVADCCRAKALDPGYAKAHSRLAALLSELRRHDEAAAELEAVAKLPGLSPNSKSSYQRRLAQARAAAQRPPADAGFFGSGAYGAAKTAPVFHHYRLLGLQQQCTQEEVRRCFKKLALLLHPDKAASSCRFATRLGPAPAAAEVVGLADRVRARLEEGAAWLFKAAQEAAEVLQDITRRRALDAELAEDEGMAAYGTSGGMRGGARYADPGSRGYYYATGGGGVGARQTPNRQQPQHRYGWGAPGAGSYYHGHRQPNYSYGHYYY